MDPHQDIDEDLLTALLLDAKDRGITDANTLEQLKQAYIAGTIEDVDDFISQNDDFNLAADLSQMDYHIPTLSQIINNADLFRNRYAHFHNPQRTGTGSSQFSNMAQFQGENHMPLNNNRWWNSPVRTNISSMNDNTPLDDESTEESESSQMRVTVNGSAGTLTGLYNAFMAQNNSQQNAAIIDGLSWHSLSFISPPVPIEMNNNLINVFGGFGNIFNQMGNLTQILTNMGDPITVTLTDNALDSLQNITYEQVTEKLPTLDIEEDCSICFDKLNADTENYKYTILPCNHVFHSDCIKEYLANYNYHCPICKMECGEHKANI